MNCLQSRAGISDGTRVVLYSEGSIIPAAGNLTPRVKADLVAKIEPG